MIGSSTHTHPDSVTLGAYHDGELGGAALAEVEAHLAACPRCRQELRELDRLDGALGALPAVEPSPDLYERALLRATNGRPRPARVGGFSPKRPLWALAAVVAALAALIGGYDLVAMPRTGFVAGAPVRGAAPAARPSQSYAPYSVSSHQAPLKRSVAPLQDAGAASAPAASNPLAPAPAARVTQGRRVARPARQGPANGTLPLSPDARLIARTGEVDLRVADVQRTYSAVGTIAARAGGYVSDSNNNASGPTDGAYAATLTLRVPAARFEDTMGRLVALAPRGGLLHERSGSQDITDGYHDLQAQLQALRATRAQLTDIMRRARSIPDAMTVLDRLTDVNTSIDGVQGQITASANSVMFSTITANIAAQPRPRKHVVAPPPRRRPSSGGWQPGRDLAGALSNLGMALQAIATLAIYAVVYLALPALLAAAALLTRRLRRPLRRA